MDTRVPARKSLPKNIGIARRGPRFFHLLIGRHEPDIVDQLSGAYRKGKEMPSFAEPHLPAVGRPIRHALMRHETAIGDRTRKHRFGGSKYMRSKLGVDTVGSNHDIRLGRCAVGKRYPSLAGVLLEAGATMAGM